MSDDREVDPAESAPPAIPPICTACNGLLMDVYYVEQGNYLCPACGLSRAAGQGGPGPAIFLRALAFGLGGAAVAGAVIWFVITFVAFYTAWLAMFAAIVVGLSVRKGSRRRGGRPFQILAVTLSYLAGLMMYGRIFESWSPEALVSVLWLPLRVILQGGSFGIWTALIFGFSLFTAWKLNRAVKVEVRGPFKLGSPLPPGESFGV